MLTAENAALLANEAIASFAEHAPDGACSGRGIVICGGGIKYGTCAWVTIRILRMLGCKLPIEVWSLNEDEHDPQWAKLADPYGATSICATDVQRVHPHPSLSGWPLKPYAMLHSSFREVLLLDADNVPAVDPTFLFDRPEYRATGAVFWPDPPSHGPPLHSDLWKIFGVSYRDEPEQESGQILVDKGRSWKALSLCNWYNEQSSFFYKHMHGDKDTFRFAWYRLQQRFSWIPSKPDTRVFSTLNQRDFDGNVLFQHRFGRKWRLYGTNQRTPGFRHEEACLEFIKELRGTWEPQRHLMRNLDEVDLAQMASLEHRPFIYDRPGNNRWRIQLGPDGRVVAGYGPNEYFWMCQRGKLSLIGFDGKRKSVLTPLQSGEWETETSTLHGIQARLIPTDGVPAAN